MIRTFFIGIFFIIFQCPNVAKSQDVYIVSINNISDRLVNIQAKLFPKNDTILMTPYGASHLKEGWATFIKSLIITNNNGEKIELAKLENGVFIIPSVNKGEQINLNYQVAIFHDKEWWPFGYKEAAYVKNEMLMTTGNALFITRLDMDSAQVIFKLKPSYKVTNAWRETAANQFFVNGAEELVWTAMAIGDYNLVEIPVGGIIVSLAFGDELTSAKKMMEATITKAIDKYKEIYGANPFNINDTGKKSVYIMNVDTAYVSGGAAFNNSISILLNSKPSDSHEAKTTTWHHILIHEIGHLWNGISLKTNEKTEWFSEGFTDFVAYKIERDIGLFERSQWKSLVDRKENEYHQAKKKNHVTMEEAGTDKARNYDIIYSGGFLFALKLDEEIENGSEGKKGIDDFLKNIFAAYSGTNKVISKYDVQEIAEKTCNCRLDNLFAELITKE